VRIVTFESVETFTPAEFAEWIATLPADDDEYELLNGRIVMNPPAGWPYGEAEADALDIGRVFGPNQGFELPSGDTVAPDLAFVSAEKWRTTVPEVGRFLGVVRDLVVEAMSPSTASRDRSEKKAIYERNGVREYWLVDARARQIVQHRLRGERFDAGQVVDADAILISEVLLDLRIPVADLLPRP
jgi:Uma2 family endonuclease